MIPSVKNLCILILAGFSFLAQAQQKIEITDYLKNNSFDQLLPLITEYQTREENRNNTNWKFYEIPDPSPFTFYNYPVEALQFYVANNQMEIIAFNLEKTKKDITNHPTYGLKNTTDTETDGVRDAQHEVPNGFSPVKTDTLEARLPDQGDTNAQRKQYLDFLNENSVITGKVIQKLNNQYSIIKEDDDCSFDCGITWQADFGTITLEKNNFSDQTEKEQWLYIDSTIRISRNRYDYRGL